MMTGKATDIDHRRPRPPGGPASLLFSRGTHRDGGSSTGYGKAFGSFGEIIQGRLSGGEDILVTLPVDLWTICELKCTPIKGPLVYRLRAGEIEGAFAPGVGRAGIGTWIPHLMRLHPQHSRREGVELEHRRHAGSLACNPGGVRFSSFTEQFHIPHLRRHRAPRCPALQRQYRPTTTARASSSWTSTTYPSTPSWRSTTAA